MYSLPPDGRSGDSLTLVMCVLGNTTAAGQRLEHAANAVRVRNRRGVGEDVPPSAMTKEVSSDKQPSS